MNDLTSQLTESSPSTEAEHFLRGGIKERKFALSAIAVGFFAATCALHALRPSTLSLYAAIRSEKLALIEKLSAQTNVAAFGSSHVDCGFDPRAFDGSLRDAGIRSSSLNLGISGGSQTEQTIVAERFEEIAAQSQPTNQPDFLLLEINSGANFGKNFLTHPRAINIYDTRVFLLAQEFADPRLGIDRALGRTLTALSDLVLNTINVGMLSTKIFGEHLDSRIIENETYNDRRGLSPPLPSLTDKDDLVAVQKTEDESRREAPAVSPAFLEKGLCAEAKILLAKNELGRFRLIYFATPKVTDLRSYQSYPNALDCEGIAVPILNVADPVKNPQLYRAELWHDINHLNERGAGVFSQLLGNAFAALQKSGA